MGGECGLGWYPGMSTPGGVDSTCKGPEAPRPHLCSPLFRPHQRCLSFQGYPGALGLRTFACAALLPGPFSQICWLPPLLFSGLDRKVIFVVMPLLTNPDHCLFFS